jgi:hypothetical protein
LDKRRLLNPVCVVGEESLREQVWVTLKAATSLMNRTNGANRENPLQEGLSLWKDAPDRLTADPGGALRKTSEPKGVILER